MRLPMRQLYTMALAAVCLIAPERSAATTFIYGANVFAEGSIGQKFIIAEFATIQTWNNANDFADSNFGTSLASITSQEELDAVETLLTLLFVSTSDFAYFGGRFSDSSCLSPFWEDGETWTGFTNWATGEPNLCTTQQVTMLNAGDLEWRNTEATVFNGTTAIILDPDYDPSASMTPIPGPLTAPLLLSALVGVGFVGRRKTG